MSTINDRILSIINTNFGGNIKAFSNHIGVNYQTIRNITGERKSKPSSDVLESINETIESLNASWLLTGNGDMLITSQKKEGFNSPKFVAENNNGIKYFELTDKLYYMSVPFAPIGAQAKYFNEISDNVAGDISGWKDAFFIVDRIGRGNYKAFGIEGDSMDNGGVESIPENSIVLSRELGKEHWGDKLSINKYPNWIIVKGNDVICKQIIDHNVEKGEITCHSLNDLPEYSDFKVSLNDVTALFNIVQVVKPNHE